MPCEGCPDDAQAIQPVPSPVPPPAAPCEGCPEYLSARDGTRGAAIIVYTGGPPAYAAFANVIRALPPDVDGVVTKWSRPTVHPKGEIEYQQNEAEPPGIEGYERDASNSRLLRPIWPPCVWRMLHVWREDTGAVSISAGCLTPASGVQVHESLRLNQCATCTARSI